MQESMDLQVAMVGLANELTKRPKNVEVTHGSSDRIKLMMMEGASSDEVLC